MTFLFARGIERVKEFFNFSAKRQARYQAWDELASSGDMEARQRLIALYPSRKKEGYAYSFKWTLEEAKHTGKCQVMLQTARMYLHGHGTAQDEEQALLWFERTLSLHILQGSKSSLNVDAQNYVQAQIHTLRRKTGR